MTLQKTLLRFMLVALAICAGAGMLIVLIPGNAIMGRVCGSGFLTAVAIGFAMTASALMDRPALRFAGVWALGATVSTYIVALLAVWVEIFSPSFDDKLIATAFAMWGCGIASTLGLIVSGFKPGRVAGRFWFACAATTLALFLAGIWRAPFWPTLFDDKAFWTAWLLSGIGSLAAIAMLGAGTDKVHWRWLGVAACAVAFAMGCGGIWYEIHEESKIFNECIIIASGIAYANLILRFALPRSQRWLAMSAIAAMAATCIGMSFMNYVAIHGMNRIFESDDFVSRLTPAFGIAAGCASVAVVILNRYNKRIHPLDVVTSADNITAVTVACPNCRKQQKAPTGSSPCVGCGLIITVKVALPHCVNCNYNTLNLNATKCPECGAALPPRGVRMKSMAGSSVG